MAVISVNLTDTFEQWRTKTNSLATQQGDLTTLTTTAKNTMVAAINEIDAASTEVLSDTTPQLGGNLDVLTRSITTSTTNGNIAITPNGSGKVVIDGISHPNADGTNGQVLQTNGSGVLSFATISSDPSMGGDLSGTASNAQLVANCVTDAEVADNALSGNKIHGGTISNFASTGIDDNASATAMTIASNGSLTCNDNTAGLDFIFGTTRLFDGNLGDNYSMFAHRDINTATAWAFGQEGSTGRTLINTPSGQHIRFSINDSEKMRLDASGNLGIGTTTPGSYEAEASQLVVGTTSGNNGITIASGSVNTGNIYFADGTTTNQKYRGFISFSHSTEDLSFATATNIRMTLDNTGKLGIGTAAPTGLLHIKSGGASTTPFRIERSGGSGDEVKVAMQGDNRPYLQMYQGGTEKIRFDVGSDSFITNDLAIGSTSASEKLHVTGNILATGNITAYSDERLKTNVQELDNTLSAIQNIRGVSYTRTDTKDNSIGVMAQDVETMFPELIAESNDGMKSVNYNGLVGVLFSAVKELSATVKQLKERNN